MRASTTRYSTSNIHLQSIWALALDIWELVALADSTRSRRRLPAVHLAVVELLTVGVCIGFLFVTIGHVTIPCNMDAPIADCPEYEDVLWKALRGYSVMFGLAYGLLSVFPRSRGRADDANLVYGDLVPFMVFSSSWQWWSCSGDGERGKTWRHRRGYAECLSIDDLYVRCRVQDRLTPTPGTST